VGRRNLEAERENRLPTFSAAAARALEDGGVLTFDGRPGLRLLRQGEVRRFVYRYRSPVDGRTHVHKIGRWPSTSWEKAVAKWEKLAEARDEGRDPVRERKAAIAAARASVDAERTHKRRAAVTGEKIVRAYLERDGAQWTKKTRYNVTRMLEGRALPAFGDMPAHEIDHDTSEPFLAKLKEEAPQLGRLLKSQLAAVWDFARGNRMLPASAPNPWRNTLVKLPAQHSERYLNASELAVFLAGLKTLDAEIEQAFRLALYCGVRTGEAVGFKARDVDLDRGEWRIKLLKGKHKERKAASYTLKLPRQAVEIFRKRDLRPFEITQGDLGAALREHKCFGLEKFTPHAVRHSVRTGLSRLKVQPEIAELCIGHVQSGGYDHHAYEEEIGEAMQKWADHLDALEAPGIVPLRSNTAGRRG